MTGTEPPTSSMMRSNPAGDVILASLAPSANTGRGFRAMPVPRQVRGTLAVRAQRRPPAHGALGTLDAAQGPRATNLPLWQSTKRLQVCAILPQSCRRLSFWFSSAQRFNQLTQTPHVHVTRHQHRRLLDQLLAQRVSQSQRIGASRNPVPSSPTWRSALIGSAQPTPFRA